MEEAPEAKRARTGTMPPEIRDEIEKALLQFGEVEYYKKSHKRGPGHVRHRCLPPEDLVHEKVETIKKRHANRAHFRCSNPKCEEPIRNDRWDTHVLKMSSDLPLALCLNSR